MCLGIYEYVDSAKFMWLANIYMLDNNHIAYIVYVYMVR